MFSAQKGSVMRSFEPDKKKLDELELICAFPKCSRIFYTSNPKALFCCDSHRAKNFRFENHGRLEHERKWNKAFRLNDEGLAFLDRTNEKFFSKRDLKLVGFDCSVMPTPQKLEDGRVCYVFFVFGLAKHRTESDKYEIFRLKK